MGYIVEKDFEYAGLRCVVIMTEMGYRCGYVRFPKVHQTLWGGYRQKQLRYHWQR